MVNEKDERKEGRRTLTTQRALSPNYVSRISSSLAFPLDVISQDSNLCLFTVRYGVQVVQRVRTANRHRRRISKGDGPSFAVFPFAVEDMKAQESVITFAGPCAFLWRSISPRYTRVVEKKETRTSGPDKTLQASQARPHDRLKTVPFLQFSSHLSSQMLHQIAKSA